MPIADNLTLLAPAFLAVAALALVIVLLHQQHGRRTVRFPSLMLWQKLHAMPQYAALNRRLPRLDPLMLLQIAVVVLAALALARPLIGDSPMTPIHRIYVLDASASMRSADGTATRFDAARAKLAQLISADIDPDGPRVSLIVADAQPRLLLARQRDDRDLLAAQEAGLQPTDSVADWTAVGGLVDSVRRAGERSELFLLTDGADSGAQALVAPPPDIAVHELRFGGPAPNAGLVASLAAVADKPNHFKLAGTVQFSGGSTEAQLKVEYRSPDATLPLVLANQTITAKPSKNEGGEAAPGDFDIDLTLAGAGVVSASLSDDARQNDNTVRFVLDAAPAQLNIALVGPAQPVLLKALQSLDGAVVQQMDALPADLEGVDLVVVNGVTVDRSPQTNTLWLGHGRVAGEPEPPGVAPGDVTSWRADHVLSRGILWDSLSLSRASKFAPWQNTQALVAAGDTPLIEARSTPHGREVRVAFEPAREWAAETSFPQFLDNLREWLGPVGEGRIRPSCTVGLECPLNAKWSGNPLSIVTGDEFAVSASSEQSTRIGMPAPDRVLLPLQAGLYRYGDAPLAGLFAVNPDSREEGNASPVTPATASETGAPTLLRLWPWLMGAAALALCLEAWTSVRRKAAPKWFWLTRGIVLLLVIAAILDLPGPSFSQRDSVVVVAAAPVAGDPAANDGLAVHLAAVRAGGPERTALITVGVGGEVDADFGGSIAVPSGAGRHSGSAADAVRLAAAMLPGGTDGRVVFDQSLALTDGDVAELAPDLSTRRIAVDVTPRGSMPPGEVAVSSVGAPPAVFSGDSFTLSGRVRAGRDTPAHLSVTEDGTPVTEQDIDLLAGENPIDVTVPKAKDGDTLYAMTVSAEGDVYPLDNTNAVHVVTMPAPRVLILSADREAGQTLADSLAAAGMQPKLMVPTAAPWLIEDWLKFDAYVMLDVPALALNTTQQELLETAVSRHGRPLLMLGGPHSFGPGGYLETVLDRLSPLSSRIPKPSPKAAIVFVIDRSGSMAQSVGDVDRLEIAKQATLSAISLLNPQSQVGVVAFDTEPHFVVPMQAASETQTIEGPLQHLAPGGGTELQPALAMALEQLRSVDSPVKHIIALTDGLTPQDDFTALVQQMSDAGISISTIAIGTDSNDRALRSIAEMGRGVFHASKDFKALPSIMTQETMLLSDSAIEERTTTPQWAATRSDFLSGMPDTLPPLEGYVLTTGKPDATIDLTVQTADGGESPLLASWRYGSGRVLALTTEANGPWTRAWSALPAYGSLWSEVVRHFMSGAELAGVAVHLTTSGDTVLISATALDDKRQPRTHLDLDAIVATPAPQDALGGHEAVTKVHLHETRPGTYDGEVVLAAPGDYRVTVNDGQHSQQGIVHIGYPARLRFDQGDGNGAALSRATGGRILSPGEALLLPRGPAGLLFKPDWVFWACCALAAFMAELFLRYGGNLFNRVRLPSHQPAERHVWGEAEQASRRARPKLHAGT